MKRRTALILLPIILLVASFLWWKNGLGAPDPKNHTQKIFVIEKGRSIRDVGNDLKQAHLIRDPVVFFVYIKKEGKDKNIQAGDYRLSPSMDLRTVVDTLNHGTLDAWVTFPEGKRAEEYADILQANVRGYEPSWRAKLNSNEGYLFPDTYLIPQNADAELVISLLKNTFNTKIEEAGISSSPASLTKVVILASLIEREARTDEEKPIIAGILTNRLAIGMALQVDATIQYAKGYSLTKKTWWPQVTIDDYRHVNSPYNTYLAPGLPPGPISNPGITALKAAANPAKTPYLYYLHDSKGRVHYAKTNEEHDKNIEQYL